MSRFSVIKGDIVKAKTDAIVNAANTSLLGGGGVDGAIHRVAGEELIRECESLNGCKTGEAKITKGYKLRAKYVIHTPGPIWRGGSRGESELLASCYRNCFLTAVENGIRTISFPSISTGVYKFPLEKAAEIAVKEITEFIGGNDDIDEVCMVCLDEKVFNVYKAEYEKTVKK